MLNSVIESDKNFYPQTFLEECKYDYIDEELHSDSDKYHE